MESQALFPMTKIIFYSAHLENTFIYEGKGIKQTVVEQVFLKLSWVLNSVLYIIPGPGIPDQKTKFILWSLKLTLS